MTAVKPESCPARAELVDVIIDAIHQGDQSRYHRLDPWGVACAAVDSFDSELLLELLVERGFLAGPEADAAAEL